MINRLFVHLSKAANEVASTFCKCNFPAPTPTPSPTPSPVRGGRGNSMKYRGRIRRYRSDDTE
jgi:hypothetical protein